MNLISIVSERMDLDRGREELACMAVAHKRGWRHVAVPHAW
jgi:hypothetical protein